jgi:hypothetical protein
MSSFFSPEELVRERELNRLPYDGNSFRMPTSQVRGVAFKVGAEGRKTISDALHMARCQDKQMTMAEALVHVCEFYITWHTPRTGGPPE